MEDKLDYETGQFLLEDGKEKQPVTQQESKQAKGKENHVLRGILEQGINSVFPILTTNYKKTTLSRKRSFVILICLYLSHTLSAWGNRMWQFAIALCLLILYPGSLLMPGIYGLASTLIVAMFATLVGDLVDTNPRFRVVWVSLLVQNSLVPVNAVLFALMFYYSWDVCRMKLLFWLMMGGVLSLGSVSQLATVASTISIERDWIVVISNGDSNTLAILNANMRRIDLICKLVSPVIAGVMLAHSASLMPSIDAEMAGGFVTTIFVTLWNLVSFVAEIALMMTVHRLFPDLGIKSLRKKDSDSGKDGEAKGLLSEQENSPACSMLSGILAKLIGPYKTLRNGWGIYWRQKVNLVGFSIASIYLTVLGLSGVTTTYLQTQGVSSDLIGAFQAMAGVCGISGTIMYPVLRDKLGTVRTGLVGMVSQLMLLSLCVIGVFIPGESVDIVSDNGYYSPVCDDNFTIFIDPNETISDAEQFLLASPVPESSDSPTLLPSPFTLNIVLFLLGVVGARFGVWMFDLAVFQLVQEQVPGEERGVVSGVMNALIFNMDMLHYTLVVIAPRPEDFKYLTLVSYIAVSVGFMLYMMYVKRVHGHVFHCQQLMHCQSCSNKQSYTAITDNGAKESDPSTFSDKEMEEIPMDSKNFKDE